MGVDLFRRRLSLHPVEGVEGRDQWQVEPVLDGMTGDAAQPIVGVDGVERRVVVSVELSGRLHALEHAVGELLDDGGQVLLGHRHRRAGRDVVQPEAGLDGLDGREVVGPGPGEHVAAHAGPGQRRRQLADVDVHASTVPGAGLGQG